MSSEDMKIAMDLYKCTQVLCKKEQETALRNNDMFKALTNKNKLECEITKCRQKAILNLANYKKMYEKKRSINAKSACDFVDKLLLKPDKITVKQYMQAVINFYSI